MLGRITEGKEIVEELEERIVGRFPTQVIKTKTGKILCRKDQCITGDIARAIVAAGIEKVSVRSVLTCETERGVCAKCYGINLADNRDVNVGEAVGIIAAQSIGEPGTQLTMRTFHSGGVAVSDITQGLPRVEEVFEARKPKGLALITRLSGIVTVKDDGRKRKLPLSPLTERAKPYRFRLEVVCDLLQEIELKKETS